MSKPFFSSGKWVAADSTEAVFNPWSGEKIADVCVASDAQVEQALASSHTAFSLSRKQPGWEVSKILTRVADLIGDRQDEFVHTIVSEAAKPINAAKAEVDRAKMTFRFAAALALADEGHGIRMDGSPQGAGYFGAVRRFPLGVILGITPFNFPLNLVAHKVAPCIASGNAMLLKPALKTPLSSLLLAEVLAEAGTIPGQVNIVPFGHEIIPKLLADQRIKMLSFTGSAAVGWKLKTQAARMKVALELGGNAAVIIEPDADWRAAIPKVAAGAFGYAGQSCISVQRVLVQRDIYETFREEFTAHVRDKIKSGDPSDPAVTVGPMINKSAREKVLHWIEEAVAVGARHLVPLHQDGASLLGPVVLENVPARSAISCEEAFAPVVVLEPYETLDDAFARVNDSAFGLQAGIFTKDVTRAFRAFDVLDVGGVMVNEVPTFRVENMPYGGIKDSGFGREGVRYAMEEMTEPKSLVVHLG